MANSTGFVLCNPSGHTAVQNFTGVSFTPDVLNLMSITDPNHPLFIPCSDAKYFRLDTTRAVTQDVFKYIENNHDNHRLRAQIFDPKFTRWDFVSLDILHFFEKYDISVNNLLQFLREDIPAEWAEETAKYYPKLRGQELFDILIEIARLVRKPEIDYPDKSRCYVRDPKLESALILVSKIEEKGPFSELANFKFFIQLSRVYNLCRSFFGSTQELCNTVDHPFTDSLNPIRCLIIQGHGDPVSLESPLILENSTKIIDVTKLTRENFQSCFNHLPSESTIVLFASSTGYHREVLYNFANHLANLVPLGTRIIAPEGDLTHASLSPPLLKSPSDRTSGRKAIQQIIFMHRDNPVPSYQIEVGNKSRHCFKPDALFLDFCFRSPRIFLISMTRTMRDIVREETTGRLKVTPHWIFSFKIQNPINQDLYLIQNQQTYRLFKLGFSAKDFEMIMDSGMYLNFFYEKLLSMVIATGEFGPLDKQRIEQSGLTPTDIMHRGWTPQEYTERLVEIFDWERQKIAKVICPSDASQQPLFRNMRGNRNLIHTYEDLVLPLELEQYDLILNDWRPVDISKYFS